MKPDTLHLIPADGCRVVDPATRKPLDAGGERIAVGLLHSVYWMRRLAEGDVTLGPGALADLGRHPTDSKAVQTTTNAPATPATPDTPKRNKP